MDSQQPPIQLNTPDGDHGGHPSVKPSQDARALSALSASAEAGTSTPDETVLMEAILESRNLRRALQRVQSNAGAPGVDGVTVENFPEQLRDRWPRIADALRAGTYRPAPVRRVDIPKSGGQGTRMLGIPTVLDRFIQQAVLQVLTPVFDPDFSPSSFGFRPGRSAHDAIVQAQTYLNEGFGWVVDLDLEKFFDRVNHDILMARVARRVKDKTLLRLIRRYLQAGILAEGVVMVRTEGTMQGGPLSPLLANILLDDWDKELERRGHRFVRYADDCNIYVRSERAAQRVFDTARRFLEHRLKLRINVTKSRVGRPETLKFLGFTFYPGRTGYRIQVAPQSAQRLKAKVRQLVRHGRGPIALVILDLNRYLRGWMGYFRLADITGIFKELDGWIRHRLRAYQWRQWPRIRTRLKHLRALGLAERRAREIAFSRKGPWRTAHGPLNSALPNAYWRQQGLFSLHSWHQRSHSRNPR